MSKLNTDEFINRAKKIHIQELDDYSPTKYINSRTKVEIICKKHGSYFQMPYTHLNACRCKTCAIETTAQKKRVSLECFINRAIKIHGDKYDYSLVDYKSAVIPIDIICPKHGLFQQLPFNHYKSGCSQCSFESMTKSTDEFIQKCIKVHGDMYDYSKVDYKGAYVPIEIVCKIHGSFYMTAASHANSKHGCPTCARERITKHARDNPSGWSSDNWEVSGRNSKDFTGFKCYIIKCYKDDEIFYKIGKTYKPIELRFKSKSSMPYTYDVLYSIESDASYISSLEHYLKREYKNYTYVPNIRFKGMYECFSQIPEELLK